MSDRPAVLIRKKRLALLLRLMRRHMTAKAIESADQTIREWFVDEMTERLLVRCARPNGPMVNIEEVRRAMKDIKETSRVFEEDGE